MGTRIGALLLAGLAVVGCATSTNPPAQASRAMREGVRAATRRYWQEALFRFNQARTFSPDDVKILNNLAIAQEATGRYDEALATYKHALEVAPRSTILKRNYARFAEFYTSYARGVKPKKDDNATK
jgi:Flp pilus assembly protein TadD